MERSIVLMNVIDRHDGNCLQEEPVASIFRERELQRSSSHKRGGGAGDRSNLDDKNLARLFVEELQDGSPYPDHSRLLQEMDDDDYLTTLQTLYDRYRAGRGNKIYEWVQLSRRIFDPFGNHKLYTRAR